MPHPTEINKNRKMHLAWSTVNSLFKSVNFDDKNAIVAIESPISQSKILSVFSKTNFIKSLASELFFLNIFLIAGKGLCNIFYKVKQVVKCHTKIAYNGSWLGEGGEYEAQNCLPAPHLMRSTNVQLTTEPPLSLSPC